MKTVEGAELVVVFVQLDTGYVYASREQTGRHGMADEEIDQAWEDYLQSRADSGLPA